MKPKSDFAVCTGHRILLVDDYPQGTIARKSVLMSLGYEVDTAESGSQALELMAVQPFDVIVTDYKMPIIDGLELIRQVRKTYPNTLIVLLSALAVTLGVTEVSSGADAVIAKSGTEVSDLTRTLRRLLTRKPARKPIASEKKPQDTPLFMVKSS